MASLETEALYELGVDILPPDSPQELAMAEAMENFASFVLEEEKELCQEILQRHLGGSVGELQGGGEDHEIYRVSITEDESGEDGAAADELLSEFQKSNQPYVLSKSRLKEYMLNMCSRRTALRGGHRYDRLGNFMFILTFGETQGQVRHIDHMDPNLQICMYMSADCPSTKVYAMEAPEVRNCRELLELWELQTTAVPSLLREILLKVGSVKMESSFHTREFSFWKTMDEMFSNFGKLYQPVSTCYSLTMQPGTALVATGNQVHAGPPTSFPRMFAFAIGVPSADSSDPGELDDENDGEVQYSPVLLHIDTCRILFGMLDFEFSSSHSKLECDEIKLFLLRRLVELLRTFPQEPFDRLVPDDFDDLRQWLSRLVQGLQDERVTDGLLEEAISSDILFFSSHVRRKRDKLAKRQKGRKQRNKS